MSNSVPGAIFFLYFKSYKSIALDRTVKGNESKNPVWKVSAEQNTKLFTVNNGCHGKKKKKEKKKATKLLWDENLCFWNTKGPVYCSGGSKREWNF